MKTIISGNLKNLYILRMKIVFDKTAIDTNMQFKQVLMIVDFNI